MDVNKAFREILDKSFVFCHSLSFLCLTGNDKHREDTWIQTVGDLIHPPQDHRLGPLVTGNILKALARVS